MPRSRVVLYREADGSVPLLDWLDSLSLKVREKCLFRIRRPPNLATSCVDPRRTFHGNVVAVVSHGLVKEDRVPPKTIDWARERKRNFETNPALHTHEGEL